MVGGWRSLGKSEFRESKGSPHELSSLVSHDILVQAAHGLDDVDAVSSGAVSTGHFTVHLRYGTAESDVSIFFVHVHNISSGTIL